MPPKKNGRALTGSESRRRPVRPRKSAQDAKGAHVDRAVHDRAAHDDTEPQINKGSKDDNQDSHRAPPPTEEERDYPPVFYPTSESSSLSTAQSIETLEDDESSDDTGGQRNHYQGGREPALHVVVLVSPRHLPRCFARQVSLRKPISPIPTRLPRSHLARKQHQN